MRRILGVVAVAGLVAGGSLVALTGTSGGDNGVGSAPLTVEKVVVGTPPPGTEFVVEVACEATQEQFGSEPLDASGPDTASTGPIYPGVSSVQVTFDATGTPKGNNVITFIDPAECTVTETQDGGAATVSYQCADNHETEVEPPETNTTTDETVTGTVVDPYCQSNGPQPEPIEFEARNERQEVTVTVTNTFVPEPLVKPITFTG